MKRSFVLFAGISLAALAGCGNPTFTPRTNAPPGAVAEYYENTETQGRSIRLTEGVAIAIECSDKKGHPCSLDGSRMDDESVATVRRAYGALDQKLVYSGASNKSYENRAVFVVVGKKAGKTKLMVRTGNGDVDVEIDIRAR